MSRGAASRAVWLLVLTVAGSRAWSAPPDAPAALDSASVPAAGSHAAILTVSAFGRYAVTVSSASGTGLQVVDRMAGPGSVFGTPGERDGRADVFLERGQYRVVTQGHPKATGEARLAVHAFTERHAQPPMLVELKPVEEALKDLEQASYWIEVKERRPVSLEAAGRSLADLRLWRDGTWLVDATPATQVVQPTVGQGLLVCRLATVLDPGLYLLTAYGGPPQPWAQESDAHPFHLRFGIPHLGEAGRRRLAVSPFGVDRFVAPGKTTYFRMELPEANAASLQVGWFEVEHPFQNDGAVRDIAKNSVPPIAEVLTEAEADREHVVTVSGAAGQPYVLQHFELREEYPFSGSGPFWVSTIHSGHPTDSVDATAILVRSLPERPGHVEPLLSQTAELDSKTGWARRANLLGTLTVFLQVREAGEYEILATGTEARFRIEPFLIVRPPRYEPPPFRGSGSNWDLEPGTYVLTADPVKKGILDLAIRPRGLVEFVLEKLGLGREVEAKPVRASARFPSVALDEDRSYTLYLNRQPEVKAGVILRALPLDLTDPLAVSQQPGETVSASFRADEPGTLRAEAEGGSLLEVSVDGGAWQEAVAVAAGTHTAVVRHSRPVTTNYSLHLEPVRLQAATPLPALPSAQAALPEFPILTEETPQYFDLPREGAATFLVRAEKPGLFRLESTGLLATEGNLRTRTVTSFARESQNGVGRNFLLQQYLREGDYQVTVAAQGSSAGHLGTALTRTRLHDGGFLTLAAPARISLTAGEAVSYWFKITKPGSFRVRAVGLKRGFRCRLEDKDGWPVVAPNIAADLTAEFGSGLYRLVILPEATAARVLTLIEPARPRRVVTKGHGPHRLPLAHRVDHVWLEPEGEGERHPDVWEVAVPAPVEATIELTGEMQGDLLRVAEDGSTSPVAFVPPGRGWKGALAKGRYRLQAVCTRRNNRAPYEVVVWPEQLVAGLDREVTAPVEIPLSVGETGLVELSSFGSLDVRARLYDARGHLVASSDDRTDDWNFHIARSLTAGAYRLRVDPVGVVAASCTVSVRVPREVEKPPLALPASLEIRPSRAAHVYPLTLPREGGLLLLGASSAESIGVAAEASAGEGWRTLGSSTGRTARIEVPVEDGARYRLRVWSLDRRGSAVSLSAVVLSPPRVSEAQLRSGAPLAPVNGLKPAVGVVAVRLDRPGLFRADHPELRWSTAPGLPAQQAPGGIVAAAGPLLWVVGDMSGGRPISARAARVTLAPDADVQLLLPQGAPAVCDLAAPKAGAVMILASSRGGQPGVRVTEGRAPAVGAGEMAVGTRSAVAVALRPSDPKAVVWAASRESEPFEVRLETWSFPVVEQGRPRTGAWEGSLEGVRARAFDLPSGPKRVHLALGESLAAVLSRGDAVGSVHWAGGDSFAETVETDADRLTVLHMRSGADRFAMEAIPIGPEERTRPLAPGASYERAHLRAGMARLAVAPQAAATDAPAMLHVRGARDEPVFVAADGRVSRGWDVPADPGGGTLLVRHRPGLLLAWADRPGEEAHDLWSTPGSVESVLVQPPASLVLSGTIRAFRLSPSEPVMIHLRTAAPLATRVKRGEGPPEVEVHGAGGVLDTYLPAGSAEMVLRALAGGTLSGTAEITSTPVTPIDEGLGPEVLLPPGATRLFSFVVAREGPVGIGVRARSDVVDSVLLSSAGHRLGHGVVQMPTLSPGTYLLALHAPEDGAPVSARPALAGLRPPDTGPPEDVIRKYLEPEEAAPRFTAVRVETPAEGEGAAEEGGEETMEPEMSPEADGRPDGEGGET